MNNLKNRVQLIGHLGADPETKNFEKGNTMTRLRLATTENYKNTKGEWIEETQWHSVVLWEQLAERAAKQLHKGSYVLVEGKLINRSYADAQGNKKFITEVRATSILSLDKKPANATTAVTESSMAVDNLPF